MSRSLSIDHCANAVHSLHILFICKLTSLRVLQMNIQDKITLKAVNAQGKVI